MSALLDQIFECAEVPPEIMDQLWASGWRHFGVSFFRYNISVDAAGIKRITPLRLDLGKFHLSKSQRRVLRRNEGLRQEFRPAQITDEARAMFQRHKGRFKENVPEDLNTFLSHDPAHVPGTCMECCVYEGEALLATSYLDIGTTSTSAVYGMFEPEHAWRSLGIYTMLLEIEHSRRLGCRYYYPGYATREPSAYDYKKQLQGLEVLDWESGKWTVYRTPEPVSENPSTPCLPRPDDPLVSGH
ncbi:MAG: arginine-tRNA-protein transferase [Verrucomicrobiota bacterium]